MSLGRLPFLRVNSSKVSVAEVWEDFGDIQEYEVSAINQPAHHSEAKEVSRYSLDGQRLTTPVKGLNIVRYSDGTIKKEAVH